MPHAPRLQVAIRFYLRANDFLRERAVHEALRGATPATLALHDSFASPQARNPDFRFPPCVVTRRGQTLREWSAVEANRSTETTLKVRSALPDALHCASRTCTWEQRTTELTLHSELLYQ